MANKLFNMFNKNNGFVQFMNEHKGQNANEILNGMISSGKVSQDQLNQVQNYVNQNMSKFNGIKGMFGF